MFFDFLKFTALAGCKGGSLMKRSKFQQFKNSKTFETIKNSKFKDL